MKQYIICNKKALKEVILQKCICSEHLLKTKEIALSYLENGMIVCPVEGTLTSLNSLGAKKDDYTVYEYDDVHQIVREVTGVITCYLQTEPLKETPIATGLTKEQVRDVIVADLVKFIEQFTCDDRGSIILRRSYHWK